MAAPFFVEHQMKDGKGIRMAGDMEEVPAAKETEKKVGSSFLVLLVVSYALIITSCLLGSALKDAKKRAEALTRASFGEVVRQKPMTLEEVAADPGVSARMGPERWYDDYCVIGGRVNDEGDYDYMRLTPEAYAALKKPSEFEREWGGGHLSIYGRANVIIVERRNAQTAAPPPEAK